MSKSTVFATMTRVRTEQEAFSIADSLNALSRLGLPIFVSDSGSLPQFVSKIEQLPGIRLRQEGATLVEQIRGSLTRAVESGADLIMYTEPDKRDFFEAGMSAFLEAAVRESDTAVVVASRDEESLRTFPIGQQRAEAAFNELAREFLGPLGDLLYGPLALRPAQLTEYLPHIPTDLGWGWRPYFIGRCIRASERVVAHCGYFPCPPGQRSEDDERSRLYRLAQLIENVRGLRSALAFGVRPTERGR